MTFYLSGVCLSLGGYDSCVAVLHSYSHFLFLLGEVPPFLLCWLYYLARGGAAAFSFGLDSFLFDLYFSI